MNNSGFDRSVIFYLNMKKKGCFTLILLFEKGRLMVYGGMLGCVENCCRILSTSHPASVLCTQEAADVLAKNVDGNPQMILFSYLFTLFFMTSLAVS